MKTLRLTPRLLVAVVALVSISTCQNEASTEQYVARIGESVLTEEGLASLLPDYIEADTAAVAREAIRSWAYRELLYHQAVSEGLHKDLKLQASMDEYRKALLGNIFLDMYMAEEVSVTTDDVREYYTRNRDQFRRKRAEVALLHFLLNTEKEALEIKGKLLRTNGTVRQELLNTYNIHAQIVSKGTLIPALDREVFGSQEPRGVLGPIRSDYGYHLLEVLEFYPANSFRGLDQVYDDISQQLFQEKSAVQYGHLLDSLLVLTPLKVHPNFSSFRP